MLSRLPLLTLLYLVVGSVYAADNQRVSYFTKGVSYDTAYLNGQKTQEYLNTCKSIQCNDWSDDFIYACGVGKIRKKISIDLTTDDPHADLAYVISRNESLITACYQQVLIGLKMERDIRKEVEPPKNARTLDNEIKLLTTALSSESKRFVSNKKVAPKAKKSKATDASKSTTQGPESEDPNAESSTNEKETPIKSYTEIAKELEEKKKLARIATKEKWYATFQIGARMMPEYNKEGDNQGFKETNFFAHFGLDNRTVLKENGNTAKPSYFGLPFLALHSGVNIDFLSSNILDCDSLPTPEEIESCKTESISLEKLGFNDVADTVNANVYSWLHFWQSKHNKSEIGIGFRYGLQSRKKLKTNGDSINSFHTVGIRYIFNDFHILSKDKKNAYKNGIPRFFLEYSNARFEEYAGLGKKTRHLVHGAYRIKQDLPIYLGLAVNGGKGPDEIALSITYGLKADAILEIFK